ncbi:hypothetical protein BJ508DRAFT_13210 [Ascobolus immersus RN42]|uniref:Uncharacterized protein n=1 Tax=Ascobolus immersus RN42 TaxID=1160509 RepID=A0A3N4IK93_ASCIM|nr:hypothetical protein BJ508DRAFT_13210 [Ascobolus immersus RN42]
MLVGLGPTSWALGIGVASFTLASGLASFLLLILNYMNGQFFNYISLLAVVVSLDKFNAFGQQLYTLFNFAEIEKKSYNMAIAYFRCRGEKNLPLFTAPDKISEISISAFLYLVNTQGLLFFYWSLILFSSSWSLQPNWWKNTKVVTATKVSCFILPGVQLALLRVPAIRDSDIWSLVIMNAIILINIGMASIFLLLTLLHVLRIHIRARGGTRIRLSRTYDGVIEYIQSPLPLSRGPSVRSSIRKFLLSSDGWLIARIILAFLMVEGLQIYMIVMQIFFLNKWGHFKREWQNGLQEPVIDQAEEFANLCSPIPASFTGFLMLLVFGSTVESRQALGRLVRICLCMRRRKEKWAADEKGERAGTPELKRSEESWEVRARDVKTRILTPVPSPRITIPKGPTPNYRFTPSPTLSRPVTPVRISRIQKPTHLSPTLLAPSAAYTLRSPSPLQFESQQEEPLTNTRMQSPKERKLPPPLDATSPAVFASFKFRFGGSISSTQSFQSRNTFRSASTVSASAFPDTPTHIPSYFTNSRATTPRSGTHTPPWMKGGSAAACSPISPIQKSVAETEEYKRGFRSSSIYSTDAKATSEMVPKKTEEEEIRMSYQEVRTVCLKGEALAVPEQMAGRLSVPWSGPSGPLRGESSLEPLNSMAYSPVESLVTPGGTRRSQIRWPWSEEEDEQSEYGSRKDSVR